MDPTSTGDHDLIERVCRHLEPFLGKPSLVYHDNVNTWIHADVHVIHPSGASGMTTLFTCGMSERFMTAPPQIPRGSYARTAELIMTLPGRWPMDETSLTDPRVFWPFGWLRHLARFPFANRTFLGLGHDVPITHLPDAPVVPCPFAGVSLHHPRRLGAKAMMPRVGSPETTVFLAVVPLLPSELEWKRVRGSESLLERFAAAGIDPEIADVTRTPVV